MLNTSLEIAEVGLLALIAVSLWKQGRPKKWDSRKLRTRFRRWRDKRNDN